MHQLRDAGLPLPREGGRRVRRHQEGLLVLPFSGTTLGTVAEKIKSYSQTKSALHFDPAKGLPVTLVRQVLRARVAELE
jgi:hypothetical protein